MWDSIWVSFPLVAGAVILFAAFCAFLILAEKSERKQDRAHSPRSSFSYSKNLPLRNITSPARTYPRPSYSLRADGFCEKASRRTAV